MATNGGPLALSFRADDVEGRIAVTVTRNDDPVGLGCDPVAAGFPVCEAVVDTPLRGYRALFGWIQLVGTRTADHDERRFEVDPLQIFEDIETPFAFYGVRPTLFDAPSRRDRHQPCDWLAHSFLCASIVSMERTINPVAAFQWGFILRDGELTFIGPEPLPLSAWAAHRSRLGAAYPSWRFVDPERT
jgi:hypothetical protein